MTGDGLRAVIAAPLERDPPVAQIDRFVFPRGGTAPAAFAVDHLYVAHNLRERLAWPLHRATRGRMLVRELRTSDLSAVSRTMLTDLLDGCLPGAPRDPASWVIDVDRRASGPERSVAFIFTDRGRQPSLVVKRMQVSQSVNLRSLARERGALEALSRTLPGALGATVPNVLAHRVAGGWESLALAWLPGRSAYADMHTRLRPAAAVRAHFDAAARWLAELHEATIVPAALAQPAVTGALIEGLGLAGDPTLPGLVARLREACEIGGIAAVRSHGDFWARNVLFDRGGAGLVLAGVVDWEESADAASPFDDLFQFALTYGLAYPWSRYRRLDSIEAFRRTFVDRTRVSRAVHRYLNAYCARRRLDPALLLPFFRDFLLSRAARGGSRGDAWIRFDATIGAAGRSVFCG
jgi:aminoglycoside phosphotransferase (APT) family kinase protein